MTGEHFLLVRATTIRGRYHVGLHELDYYFSPCIVNKQTICTYLSVLVALEEMIGD